MIRVYEKFQDNPNFGIISHTIDPRHDSISVLKEYKDRLGIKGDSWQFVTGEQEKIYEIAQKDYMVSALEDSTAVNEGGFIHSGAFVLVDKQKRIRGVYDGTKEVEVNKLIKDIELLLKK
jgi:protein SCO1